MANKTQKINCSVSSCRYNDNNNDCTLDDIQVAPCSSGSGGDPEDESYCDSYIIR
ncbi:MAG: DUF1540 domain-containing protein [Bacillota bacterium]|nr:DUF1540 domain-containing protein [Bacillota bacterium]